MQPTVHLHACVCARAYRRVDAGQCRLLNNLAELAAREMEAHCRVPERLASTSEADDGLRNAYATSVGGSDGGWVQVPGTPGTIYGQRLEHSLHK